MADTVAKGAGGLPAAIERARLVTLPVCGKSVEVRRWSFLRNAEISRFLNEIVIGLPNDVASDAANSISVFYQHGPQKMLEVARLSLSPDHRGILDQETDSDDVFAILEAAFEINGDSLGKMQGLAGNFVSGKAAAEALKKNPPKQEK